MPKFERTDTQVLGVSVDSVPANHAFAKQIGVTFPLLSDFFRKVSEEYGVLNAQHGFANRTICVDSVPANHAFAKQIGVTFPLLSDFFRKVSEEYGVLNAQHGFANRTTFVI